MFLYNAVCTSIQRIATRQHNLNLLATIADPENMALVPGEPCLWQGKYQHRNDDTMTCCCTFELALHASRHDNIVALDSSPCNMRSNV